ncbi:MAG: hypothetical protein ACNA8W_23875, partial [Bradymonadaceae bacterium]
DTPVITWRSKVTSNNVTSDKIWTRKWDGQDWIAMTSNDARVNTVNNAPGDSNVSCVTPDRCMVAFEQSDQLNGRANNLYVRRLEGNSWRTMGESLNIDSPTNSYALDINIAIGADDLPIVAWRQFILGTGNFHSHAYVSRWNRQSEQWDPLGALLDFVPAERIEGLFMVIDENGQPIVGFSEENKAIDRWDVYMRRYNQ